MGGGAGEDQWVVPPLIVSADNANKAGGGGGVVQGVWHVESDADMGPGPMTGPFARHPQGGGGEVRQHP